jgi:hypothetical protein
VAEQALVRLPCTALGGRLLMATPASGVSKLWTLSGASTLLLTLRSTSTPADPYAHSPLRSALVRTLTPYRGEGYHPYLEAIRVQDHTAERAPRRVHTRRVRGGRPGVRPVRGAAKRGGEGVADEEQVRVISRSCERLRLGSSEWLFDHLFGILDRRRAIVSDFPRFSDGPVFSRCIELSVDARMGPDCPRFR